MKNVVYSSVFALAVACSGFLGACGAEPAFTGSTFAPLDEAEEQTNGTSGERVNQSGDDATDRDPTRSQGPGVDPRRAQSPAPKGTQPSKKKAGSLGHNNDKIDPLEPAEPTPTPTPEPLPTPVAEDPVELCRSNRVQRRTVSIVFEERRSSCPWSVGDNLSLKDGVVRSRIEDVRDLGLQLGSTLCGMSISSKVQDIQFDDEILLTFNDRILMSSYDYTGLFTKQDGHFQYSWGQLANAFNPGPSTPWKPYCLGASPGEVEASCKVPKTQTVGSFELRVPFEDSVSLSNVAKEQGKAQIGLIVTGDNDEGDCSHSEISLDVELRYVEMR